MVSGKTNFKQRFFKGKGHFYPIDLKESKLYVVIVNKYCNSLISPPRNVDYPSPFLKKEKLHTSKQDMMTGTIKRNRDEL